MGGSKRSVAAPTGAHDGGKITAENAPNRGAEHSEAGLTVKISLREPGTAQLHPACGPRNEKRPPRAGILGGLQAGLIVRVQSAAGNSTQMRVAGARASHRRSFIRRWGCFMRASSSLSDWGLGSWLWARSSPSGRLGRSRPSSFHRYPCAGASSMEKGICNGRARPLVAAPKIPFPAATNGLGGHAMGSNSLFGRDLRPFPTFCTFFTATD
jgi:hypothetical protein